jgi:hypothetical protein
MSKRVYSRVRQQHITVDSWYERKRSYAILLPLLAVFTGLMVFAALQTKHTNDAQAAAIEAAGWKPTTDVVKAVNAGEYDAVAKTSKGAVVVGDLKEIFVGDQVQVWCSGNSNCRGAKPTVSEVDFGWLVFLQIVGFLLLVGLSIACFRNIIGPALDKRRLHSQVSSGNTQLPS